MKNNENLKKQIIYRSTHRGTKEMDLLLGNFVKKHINKFNDAELLDLKKLIYMDDEVIFDWYLKRNQNVVIPKTNESTMLKNFKL